MSKIRQYSNIFFAKIKCTPKDLLRFIELQLFITLVSWPLLLYWGLPLSLASPIGNFIFAPLLTIFLLLSSIIFFLELLFIPNGIFISALEYINQAWVYVIFWAKNSWLLCCAQPTVIFALFLPFAAIIILHNKKFSSPIKCIIMLIFMFASATYLKYVYVPPPIKNIECFNKNITLINNNGICTLIDSGTIGRRISAPTWITFTLTPILIKMGIAKLDLILLKPSTMTFKAVSVLLKKICIKNIYIASWHGKLKNTGWKAWQELLEECKNSNVKLTYINDNIDINDKLIVEKGSNIKRNNLIYPSLTIHTIINGESINIKNF